jgi:hypothetical protein
MAYRAGKTASRAHGDRNVPSGAFISRLAGLAEEYAEKNPKASAYLFEALIKAIKTSRDLPDGGGSQGEAEDIAMIRRRISALERQIAGGQTRNTIKSTCNADILQEFLNVFRSNHQDTDK